MCIQVVYKYTAMAITFRYEYYGSIIIHHGQDYLEIAVTDMIDYFRAGTVDDNIIAKTTRPLLLDIDTKETLQQLLFGPCTCEDSSYRELIHMGVPTRKHSNWLECLALQILIHGWNTSERGERGSFPFVLRDALLLASLGYRDFLNRVSNRDETPEEKFRELYKYQSAHMHDDTNIVTTAASAVLSMHTPGSITKAAMRGIPLEGSIRPEEPSN